MVQQRIHHSLVSILHRQKQRRLTFVIDKRGVGSPAQQIANAGAVARSRCEQEQGVALVVLQVDVQSVVFDLTQ